MAAAGFLPLGTKARWVVVLLATTAVVDTVGALLDLWEIHLMSRLIDGRSVGVQSLADSDHRQSADALAGIVILVGTAAAFINWFHAAYRNTRSLGASAQRFTPGWAIGAWFVPFVNLVRPYRIADDTWRASDPTSRRDQGAGWQQLPTSGLVRLWWGTWIAGGLIGGVAARTIFRAGTAVDVRATDLIDLASRALLVAAAVLAISMVRQITRRQDDRKRLLTLEALPSTGA